MNIEEETINKIKFMISCNNDYSAIRVLEQYKHFVESQQLNIQKKEMLIEYEIETNNINRNDAKEKVDKFLNQCSI